jgi:hypothetical protein
MSATPDENRALVREAVEDGVLDEHWDVIEDEAGRAESRSGLPAFGDRFPRIARRSSRSELARRGPGARRDRWLTRPEEMGVYESSRRLEG